MIELISINKINSPDYMRLQREFNDIWLKLFLAQGEIESTIKKLSFLRRVRFAGSILNSALILRSNQLWSVRNWEYPWAVLNAEIKKESKVLDVGSGWSLFPLYLAGKSDNVDAIDIDALQMNTISPALARILQVKVNYKVGDALGIPSPDDNYDFVFCISTLEHLEEQSINGELVSTHEEQLEKAAVNEFIRVIKPGGRVVLTLQYGNENSDRRSFLHSHMTKLAERFWQCLLVKPVDYNGFKFQEQQEKEMTHLAASTFPYENGGRPTGSIGIILTK